MPVYLSEIKLKAQQFMLNWKGKMPKTCDGADLVNIEVAEKVESLYDALSTLGYAGDVLALFLMRLLFCLFADDIDIFEANHFIRYILQYTNLDGSDLAMHMQKIFEVLNTPCNKRSKTLSEDLNKFPYVDVELFNDFLPITCSNHSMRQALLDCATLDWSLISPSILGAMFQSVMSAEARHSLGAHYTSEENILKVLHPLFLDSLWQHFDDACKMMGKAKTTALRHLHNEISKLHFLDPACGSGNFLVLAYRELRLLELSIIEELQQSGKNEVGLEDIVKVSVRQFIGIELEEFPTQIARVAMYLQDRQMNHLFGRRFSQYPVNSQLKISAKKMRTKIVCANALKIDWSTAILPGTLSYIFGNPPFLGSRKMNTVQKAELKAIFPNIKHRGDLDYVACWYKKASQYIKGTNIECAFISTNSICQGLQMSILWRPLFAEGIHINFAHQTFKWNEAKDEATVYCIIVGFSLKERNEKLLYLYDSVKAEPRKIKVKHINSYLMDANDIFIERMQDAICDVPKMYFGNMPADGGALIMNKEELEDFLKVEPKAKKFIKQFLGANEFIYDKKRYCLWLAKAQSSELRAMPHVMKRIERCKKVRECSSRPHLANIPSLFAQITQPVGLPYLLVPATSSDARKYIPIGFLDGNVIASNATLIIPNASVYHFAILTSKMHMVWTRAICGRLGVGYRYSKDVVYNNFPWPEATEEEQEFIAERGQAVLETRKLYPAYSFSYLYDPLTMPESLSLAHALLDDAVDSLYSKHKFASDAERLSHLFNLYEKMTIAKRVPIS